MFICASALSVFVHTCTCLVVLGDMMVQPRWTLRADIKASLPDLLTWHVSCSSGDPLIPEADLRTAGAQFMNLFVHQNGINCEECKEFLLLSHLSFFFMFSRLHFFCSLPLLLFICRLRRVSRFREGLGTFFMTLFGTTGCAVFKGNLRVLLRHPLVPKLNTRVH